MTHLFHRHPRAHLFHRRPRVYQGRGVMFFFHRFGLGAAALAGVILSGGLMGGAQAEESPVVLELFTSQGCSSCPPADEVAENLATRDDLLVLTLPVDYWDYLGWKDTLALPAFTSRQRSYARNLGERRVYTPQMMIDGVEHRVGSRRGSVLEAANERRRSRPAPVEMSVNMDANGDAMAVTVPAAGESVPLSTLWLVRVSALEEVVIGRGENAGRTVSYAHVVREMSPLASWTGDLLQVMLPVQSLEVMGYDGQALILQEGATGPVLGAMWIDRPAL